MDTVLQRRPLFEKAATSAVGLVIAICLLLSQDLISVANDIGHISGFSPDFSDFYSAKLKKELKFESEINRKYGASNVYDVEKGIKHVRIIRFYENKPVRINIVEMSLEQNNGLIIEPSIASSTLSSKRKISAIANEKNAIVAINGGFFKPQTGVPLGTLVINKKVYTGPIYDRVSMGIFDNGFDMARVKLDAKLITNKGGLKIDNFNQPRMLSTNAIVYTSDWGKYSPSTPKYGKQLVIKNNRLLNYTKSVSEIPKDGFVVVGPQKDLDKIVNARDFRLNVKFNPNWKNVKHVISGGPYLVKNGDIYVDTVAQKLLAINGRNPRTAIGYTKNNSLIMLTADGREGSSIGLTLSELASLMKEFGCVNAMNLDGGGSTVMYIKGNVVNKPAVQGGIPLSNTLLIRKIG